MEGMGVSLSSLDSTREEEASHHRGRAPAVEGAARLFLDEGEDEAVLVIVTARRKANGVDREATSTETSPTAAAATQDSSTARRTMMMLSNKKGSNRNHLHSNNT